MSSTTTAATVVAISAFALVGITFAQSGSSSPKDASRNTATVPAAVRDVGAQGDSVRAIASPFGPSVRETNNPFGPAKSIKNESAENSQWVGGNADRFAKIEAALEKETNAGFTETPLNEVIARIGEEHDLQIIVDEIALEEFGLSKDVGVTLMVKALSLESMLNLICRDLDLTYTIDNEVLEITTQEAAEDRLLTRVYWSGEKGMQLHGGGMQVIEATVQPDTWEALGGPSTMAPIGSEDDETSGLVVSTTYRVHRKIEALLNAIADGTSTKVSAPEPQVRSNVFPSQSAPTQVIQSPTR